MYCPQCGAPAAAEPKYCRSCGLLLEVHAAILSRQTPETDKLAGKVSELVRPLRSLRTKMSLRGLLTIMASLMLGSLFLVAAGLKRYSPEVEGWIPILLGLSGFLLFAGSSFLIYAGYLPKESDEEAAGRPTTLRPTHPAAGLPPERRVAPLPGATERTTDLLEAAEVKLPIRDTARRVE